MRLYNLAVQSLNGDEAFSVLLAAGSLRDQAQVLVAGERNPPLFFTGLHFWFKLAGDSELAARFPSVAFGTLLIPLAFVTARRVAGPTVGIITALLVAVNPFLIWYSQDARSYSMLTLLTVGSLYCAARLLAASRPKTDRVAVAGLVVCGVLSVLTHYAAFVFLAAENAAAGLALLKALPKQRPVLGGRARAWLGAQIGIVLLVLPWLLYVRNVFLHQDTSDAAASGLPSSLVAWATSFSLGPLNVNGSLKMLAVLFVIPLVFGLGKLARSEYGRFAIVCLVAAVPLAFAGSLLRPRYLIFVVPLYAFALAVGLQAIRRRAALLGAVALVAILAPSAYGCGLYYFDPAQVKSPYWRPAVAQIMDGFSQGDLLLADTLDPSLVYYSRRAARGSPTSAYYADEVAPQAANGTPAEAARLGRVLSERERVWLSPAGDSIWDPERANYQWLMASALPTESWTFHGLGVTLFATPRELLEAHPRPKPRSFEGNIDYLGYDLAREEAPGSPDEIVVQPGGHLWVTLYFRATSDVSADLRVFNHLVDASGKLWAQHDGIPALGARPTQTWRAGDLVMDRHRLDIPSDTPPGRYLVRSGLYDLTTMARLSLLDESKRPAGDAVEIGGIVVVSPRSAGRPL